ncbi:MarR family winged helix-turn-helix transcriptional regulator [Williamsia sp. M5A3_1d]
MTETRWLSDDEQRMWRAYLDSTRMLLHRLDQQLVHDAGVSFTDYELLVRLSEAPGRRLRMSQLATAVTATRSGVTRAISRLVDAGWVERTPCPDDRRGAWAVLTDAGAGKLESASAGHVEAVRANVFDVLSPRDVDSLGAAYAEMRQHMQELPAHA